MKVNYSRVFIVTTAAMLFVSSPGCTSTTDERIESSAKQSYVFRTYLKDESIDVKSKNGLVTLTGSVMTESHRSLAQETVANLPGVESVDNRLKYSGEPLAEKSDGWIGVQVKSSLLYNRHVSGFKTQVLVDDGFVTLRGEALNQAQKDLTAEYAKDIEGVKGVNNEMTVSAVNDGDKKTMGEKIDDASITAQVKMAFITHRSTSVLRTGVETNDGVVTLTGKAGSEAAKDMAAKVAGDVKGVVKVINNMAIDDALSKN